jgi:hypothetical protein
VSVVPADDLEGATPIQGGGVVSADDLAGATPVEEAAAPAAEQPGRLEALARGAKQGVTFGFGDELAGALDYVLSGGKEGSYTKGRDEARARDAAAKEAHGGYFTAGEVGGGVASSFLPGVGAVGGAIKGAGLAANAVRGAGAGILSGIGNSEGKSVQDIAKDAAISGLAGGAVGGVAGAIGNKLVGGAAQRVENAELAGLKEGVQYSTKLKTFGKATPEAPEGQFTGAIKAALKAEPEIKSAVNKDAHRALSMVEQKVDGLTDTLDHIYSKADLGGPVPVKNAADGLEEAAKKFTTTADEGIADTIRNVGQRLAEKYPQGIPVPALRAEYRGWQDLANKSMKLFNSKSPREEAAEATANALRETLQSHIATVAEEMPHLGISRKALEATNKEVSTWLKVQGALTEKASRQNIEAAPFGDTVNAVGNLIKAPIKTTLGAIGKLGRPADQAVAKMIVAAQRGDKMAQMALRALQTGAPRGLAANAEALPGAALDAVSAPFLPNDQPY